MDLNETETHPDDFGASYELREKALRCGIDFAHNLGVEGSVRRKPDHGGVQGRSGYRRMIDLEKLATSEDDDDDDVEILSSARFSDYTNRKGGFLNNCQCRLLAHASSDQLWSILPWPA